MWPTAVSQAAPSPEPAVRSGVALTVAAWALGLVLTVLLARSPVPLFGFRSPSLHLVLDTADAFVALLVAYLVHGRFVRRRRWQDRLLAQGLVLLAVAGLGLTYLATSLPGVRAGTVEVWLPLTVRVGGAVCIVLAALADGRPVQLAFARRHAWLLPLLLVLVVSATLWRYRDALPVAVPPTAQPQGGLALTGHPVLLLAQSCSALCFFVASVAFARQSSRQDDELLRWLGPACALGAFARVDYALFPSLYTDWLYVGDLLRTGCYLLLLVGAARELQQYWTVQAHAAVLEDRRRLARELHDGVVQELGYIRAETYALPASLPAGERILAACDRGLDEARAAVHALGRPQDEPLAVVLQRAGRELGERYLVDLRVEADPSVVVDADQQHALMRIAREAVSNAVRHGQAERVRVELGRSAGQRVLTIQDEGRGFDPRRVREQGSGYGLLSMRDRARALPGSLQVDAAPGRGCMVTVIW